MKRTRFRAVWISDVHLGTRDCKADYLLDFLHSHDSDHLYLVGDLIDFWDMKKGHWPDSHQRVLGAILDKAENGTRVVYVPGNHDGLMRDCIGLFHGRITLERETVHTTADGRRLLVVHGDEIDDLIATNAWLAWVGDWGYSCVLWLNRRINHLRLRRGLPYYPLATAVKGRIRRAARYIDDFERQMARQAGQRGFDGVICGHIHKPALGEIEGILYGNDGDWVENCTALVEQPDGRLEMRHWAGQPAPLPNLRPVLARQA